MWRATALAILGKIASDSYHQTIVALGKLSESTLGACDAIKRGI
jgi:hypothetical protein